MITCFEQGPKIDARNVDAMLMQLRQLSNNVELFAAAPFVAFQKEAFHVPSTLPPPRPRPPLIHHRFPRHKGPLSALPFLLLGATQSIHLVTQHRQPGSLASSSSHQQFYSADLSLEVPRGPPAPPSSSEDVPQGDDDWSREGDRVVRLIAAFAIARAGPPAACHYR